MGHLHISALNGSAGSNLPITNGYQSSGKQNQQKIKPSNRIGPFARFWITAFIGIFSLYIQVTAYIQIDCGRKRYGYIMFAVGIFLAFVSCFSVAGDWWNIFLSIL